MGYTVKIIKNNTKEERFYFCDLEYDDYTVFWLTKDDFGCDCNRYLMFQRAKGEDCYEDVMVCGNDEYYVPNIILEDNTIIPVDGFVYQKHL